MEDVVIIGAGCAGLSAAIYTSRANLKTLVFAGDYDHKGGLLVKTSVVENYPGFPDGINGYDLIARLEQQAINTGATIECSDVTNVAVDQNNTFTVTSADGKIVTASAIIVATGSTPLKLNLEHEDLYWGTGGISSCAVCDGALYKNKKIIVCGGGDSAAEEALFLTKFSNVIIIHRRDKLRASHIMQQRLFNHPNIQIIFDTEIVKLIGDATHLTAIQIKNVKTSEITEVPVDGLFYGLGLKPTSELFRSIVDIDDGGYIKHRPDSTHTSTHGIFAAGDVSDHIYRQAIVAAGSGCMAAMDAITYLSSI